MTALRGHGFDGRRIGWWVALVLWLGVIWGHSTMPATDSAKESLFIVDLIRGWLAPLGITDTHLMDHLVRKAAHFNEYAALAALGTKAFDTGRADGGAWKGLVPLAVLWVMAPCVDETIQLFTPGRAGMVRDVLLDMCGFAAGAAVMLRRHLQHISA